VSAKGVLNGVQFGIDTSDPGLHEVTAEYQGRQVGQMLFDPTDGGRVTNIWSQPTGRGIATGMWNHARENGHQVRHSDTQTKDGKRWARAVGD
jgi:hypothetical protein